MVFTQQPQDRQGDTGLSNKTQVPKRASRCSRRDNWPSGWQAARDIFVQFYYWLLLVCSYRRQNLRTYSSFCNYHTYTCCVPSGASLWGPQTPNLLKELRNPSNSQEQLSKPFKRHALGSRAAAIAPGEILGDLLEEVSFVSSLKR